MSGFTVADAATWLLDKACRECGTALPAAGEPCPACGVLPAMTAPELEAEMEGPGTLARVAAAKLRVEARQMQDQMLAKYREADRVLHMAGLEDGRARAQGQFEVAVAARRELTAPLRAAKRAEANAARELQSASAEHDAFRAARRMRKGLRAETQAARDLATATEVLERYRQAFSQARAARQSAEAALAAASERLRQAEAGRDKAVAACDKPDRIPVSVETIIADLVRLVLTGALEPVEMMMAQAPVRWLAGMTGLADAMEAEARRRLLDEQEAEERNKPLRLAPIGDGSGLVAGPNPLNTSAPQMFHPPPGDRGNAGHQRPILGGF